MIFVYTAENIFSKLFLQTFFKEVNAIRQSEKGIRRFAVAVNLFISRNYSPRFFQTPRPEMRCRRIRTYEVCRGFVFCEPAVDNNYQVVFSLYQDWE